MSIETDAVTWWPIIIVVVLVVMIGAAVVIGLCFAKHRFVSSILASVPKCFVSLGQSAVKVIFVTCILKPLVSLHTTMYINCFRLRLSEPLPVSPQNCPVENNATNPYLI